MERQSGDPPFSTEVVRKNGDLLLLIAVLVFLNFLADCLYELASLDHYQLAHRLEAKSRRARRVGGAWLAAAETPRRAACKKISDPRRRSA